MLSASKCIVCGSGPLISDAGYYFCADCGAQQEGRETEQEFGAFGQQGRRINKPKKDRDLDAQKKERAKKLREDPYLTERALSQKDYPFWLDQIGTRLCTSTKILAKCSSVLINEFNVPEKFMEKSKFIFYNYLRYFGIAFCNEEITDDSNKLFCPLVRHRNVEIEKKLAQNKKRATNLRKILEKERKEKSDAWMDLTSTNEALEKVLEEEEAEIAASLEEVQFVERINTSLSVEAVNMAASIYLGIDLLLCILFLSLNLSGCRWILLSDIFRWYREGRFNISRSQLLALNFSTFWAVEENPNIKDMITSDNVERRFYVRNRYTIPYLAIQPISESLRVLAFITQFVDIPRCIETLDFQKVLSRFVYNLNLPKVFLKHLITICSFLPDVNVDYGAERFSYVQPVDKGLRQHLLFLSSSGARSHKSLGFVSFFQRAFLVNKSQKCWEKVEGTEVYDRIDPLFKYGSHWHFVPLPTEVKAVAIILFALKLFFGLDDQREYSLKAKQQIMEDEELNFFNFGEWLYQLEMRTHCWQGTDAKVVMSNDFYFDQLERSGFQESSLIALFQRPHLGMRIYTNNRFLPFRGCIPNNVRVQSQPYIFENLFPTYLAPTPSKVLRSDDNTNLNMSNEALFTPLQYQSLKNNNIKNKSSKIIGIDKNKKRIFFNNFYETNLDLELPSNLNSSEPIECNIIQKMFPCANNYKRYSPGFYKNIAILIPEFDENGFTNEQLHNQIRINSLPITPLLATKPLKMLLLSTERQFSKSFGRLLKHLALAACETDHLLFFTFQMIETMFFERTNFNRIRNDLCQYGRFMFYTYRNSQSSKRETNSRFRYTINLDKQLNNNYNIPTNKFCFKLTRAHERNLHVFNKKEIEDNIIFQRCFFYDVNPQNIIPAAPFEVSGPFTFIQPQYKKVTVSDSDHTDDEDLVNNTKNIEIGDFLSSSSSSNDSDDDLLEENIQRPTERTGKKYPIKMVSLPAPISLALCALKYW